MFFHLWRDTRILFADMVDASIREKVERLGVVIEADGMIILAFQSQLESNILPDGTPFEVETVGDRVYIKDPSLHTYDGSQDDLHPILSSTQQ